MMTIEEMNKAIVEVEVLIEDVKNDINELEKVNAVIDYSEVTNNYREILGKLESELVILKERAAIINEREAL